MSLKQEEQSLGPYETLITTKCGVITKITLNRPQKKNAISAQTVDELISCLEKASQDDTVLTIITGAGDFYSSGIDLSILKDSSPQAQHGVLDKFQKFVSVLIDFPKILIGLVNGPAIGMGVTMLPLFDFVYASNKAFFQTPFSKLGVIPEACSSYTFYKLMGPLKANEILVYGKKLTMTEAKECNLITEMFPEADFQNETSKRIEEMKHYSAKPMLAAKSIYRKPERDILHKTNEEEVKILKSLKK